MTCRPSPVYRASLVIVAAWLIGCTGPSLQARLAPYPVQGQHMGQLQADSADCDAWARSSAGSGGEAAAAGTLGGAVVGSALGAGLGAIAGSFFGAADTGAAMGAALGGVQGAAHGGAGSAAAWDARLTAAYRNCMAARGYAVEGAVVVPAPASSALSWEADGAAAEGTRLAELEDLRDDGLITESEYKRKRREIVGIEGSSVEDRLRELRHLFDQHLVSKSEYDNKRREILDDL